MDLASPAVSGTSVYANGLIKFQVHHHEIRSFAVSENQDYERLGYELCVYLLLFSDTVSNLASVLRCQPYVI